MWAQLLQGKIHSSEIQQLRTNAPIGFQLAPHFLGCCPQMSRSLKKVTEP